MSESAQPLTMPASGYLRAEGLALTYVGQDPSVAELTVPERLPTAGAAVAEDHPDGLRLARPLPGGDAEALAREHVQLTGRPAAVGVVVQRGGTDDAPVSLLSVQSIVRPVSDVAELWDGLAPLQGELGRLETVLKAALDPLDPDDFDKIVASLSTTIRRTSGKIEREMLASWLDRLKFDWPTATDAQMLAASKSLNAAMREASGDVWAGIRGKLRTSAQSTASGTRRSQIRTDDLQISGVMSLRDRQAVNRSVATNAHYIRDYYGRVHPAMSEEMRSIAQEGIEQGLGQTEIARNIRRGLTNRLKPVSDSYYNVVASAVNMRSRTFSQLTSFRDAGIERYVFEAVLDEVTTETCFAAGTLVSTPAGDRPIENIRPDDLVITGSGQTRRVRVKSTRPTSDWRIVTTKTGRSLTVTPNHPLLTSLGWMQAWALRPGNKLATRPLSALEGCGERAVHEYLRAASGSDIVESVAVVQQNAPSYNLEVEDDPTYIAEELIVHNCRFLHGTEFSVGDGLARYAAADRLKEGPTLPTQLNYEMPWTTERVIQSGEHEGKRGIYVPSREGLQRVAVIERPGYGKADAIGRYSNAMSPRQLANANMGLTPQHMRCRSIIVPAV